jgi:hypothetical protein
LLITCDRDSNGRLVTTGGWWRPATTSGVLDVGFVSVWTAATASGGGSG